MGTGFKLRTRLTEMFGVDVPIFAFTHTREVVVAVSRAGGIGIYGASPFSPDRVAADLAWIVRQLDGLPFGVDVMIPLVSEGKGLGGGVHAVETALDQKIPQSHRRYVDGLLNRFQVPPLPAEPRASVPDQPGGRGWRSPWNEYRLGAVDSGSLAQVEIALDSPICLLVSALGPPPPEVRERAQKKGIRLGALVGSVRHAEQQVAAGVDIVIAQGHEAAAHTGEISTLVLVPDVVDAVSPIPVLAAGGVGCGRQLAAALALGAEGVWTGSVWLATTESDEPPEVKARLLAASASDTVRSSCRTGKPLRQLRSPWSDAWAEADAPPTLPMPLQHLLTADAEERIHRNHRADLTTIPVGQIVGRIRSTQSCAQVLGDMVAECQSTLNRLQAHPVSG